MSPLSRRELLLGGAGAVLLAACGGGDDDGGGSAATTTSTAAGGGLALGVAFDRSTLVIAGAPQRLPFLLLESTGGLLPAGDAPASLAFEVVDEGGQKVEQLDVERHGTDVDRAYFPLTTTFASPGTYDVRTSVDGNALSAAVTVNDAAAIAVPQVGQPLPNATTPTVADPLDTLTLCTREEPCPFHDVSLDAALAEGRPVALIVSTPAFCNVAICGPTLEVVLDAARSHPDLTYIHVEVYPYEPPPDGGPQPLLQEQLKLHYEPVLFTADATGTITSRLDFIWDGPELEDALTSAV